MFSSQMFTGVYLVVVCLPPPYFNLKTQAGDKWISFFVEGLCFLVVFFNYITENFVQKKSLILINAILLGFD